MNDCCVTLVGFYNKKALGVRYLDRTMRGAGYGVRTVFYKDFNSVHPSATTETELELLMKDLEARKPLLLGLSVMSSMYLETVNAIIEKTKAVFPALPIVCGGAFATMFPDYFLNRGVRFVIRSDGEHALPALADALRTGGDYRAIPSLCYIEDGAQVINEIGNIVNEIDEYGLPSVICRDVCFIENDRLVEGDPQRDTLSYEVIASRGCPFTCSYCCCVNLHRLLPKGIHGVRSRSVDSVMQELHEAKQNCKKIVFVHFYDEIFPNVPGWLDEFVERYDREIHLPFTIWSHPKMVDAEMLRKLVKVGLTEVIMGIQSGSDRVRRDVFHRYETREDIIQATKVIKESGVFWCSYDFMLQHPFETIEDLKESYYLIKDMYGPFELQLHGLNFLPGTDIVPMAIEQGYYTSEEMDAVMYASMEEQFGAYWQRHTSKESELWFRMMDCLQFGDLRRAVTAFEDDPLAHEAEINAAYAKAQKKAKMRYLYKKSRIVLKRYLHI